MKIKFKVNRRFVGMPVQRVNYIWRCYNRNSWYSLSIQNLKFHGYFICG